MFIILTSLNRLNLWFATLRSIWFNNSVFKWDSKISVASWPSSNWTGGEDGRPWSSIHAYWVSLSTSTVEDMIGSVTDAFSREKKTHTNLVDRRKKAQVALFPREEKREEHPEAQLVTTS